MILRSSLCLFAALALGGAKPPAAIAPGGNGSAGGDALAGVVAHANWRVIEFRGAPMHVPPGVHALTSTTVLFGTVEMEVPDDVVLEFNERGEAVFTLAPDASPHAFVVRVGAHKVVSGARSRLIVPNPAVGRPRYESVPNSYRVPTPREFLDQSYDLGDPLDASPFR